MQICASVRVLTLARRGRLLHTCVNIQATRVNSCYSHSFVKLAVICTVFELDHIKVDHIFDFEHIILSATILTTYMYMYLSLTISYFLMNAGEFTERREVVKDLDKLPILCIFS